MKIYNYHPITKEFISETDADESPLEEGVFLIPAHATDVEPPTVANNQVACFKDGKWELSDDFRGVEYWLPDGTREIITKLDVVVPENSSLEKIEPPAYPNLESAKSAMVAWADSFTDGITGPVPVNEKHSWSNKNTLPEKFENGTISNDELALINAEILFTGETQQELIDKIKPNAEKYALVAAMMAGLRRATNKELEAATDPYQYEAILEGAKTKAITALQSLENV